MDVPSEPPPVCHACGHVHTRPEHGVNPGNCPLTGGRATSGVGGAPAAPDPRFASARSALFRWTHDEWLALTVSYVLDDRDGWETDRYARLWREFYTYYTLMCYPACSPRISDPAYRSALIDGYLVTIAVAKNFDPDYRDAARKTGEAEDALAPSR